MSNNMLTRIATLMSSGLRAAQISSIVGISPARISQIATTEEFKLILADKKVDAEKQDAEDMAIAAKYLSAEHLLINQILDMAPSAELRDVTNALKVVSERQLLRNKAASMNGTATTTNIVAQQIVQISLPIHALPEYYISQEREVISIDNQNLAPLSSTGVTSLFENMRAKAAENAPQLVERPSLSEVLAKKRQKEEVEI